MLNHRSSGILMHISSLRGKEPIGTLGTEAFDFVDFLFKSGQKIWQILPMGPTGYGNSPYQCFSAHAGNHFLISLDELVKDNLLAKSDILKYCGFSSDKVNYSYIAENKELLLKKAYREFLLNDNLKKNASVFYDENKNWLDDYALFMALKKLHKQIAWCEWEEEYKNKDTTALKDFIDKNFEEILYQKFLQYIFFKQWYKLRKYANDKNISIIGDIPIYVSYDSADCWTNREYFLLDDDGYPLKVAGVPPDYFSENGQLWGNPLFNWDKLEEDNFSWWVDRIKSNLDMFDIIRIDHFRGLSQFWAIPYGEKTAVNGKWFDAPGHALFRTIYEKLGKVAIIAEDLGVITEDVIELRETFKLPGMKILQFAFDSKEENNFIPHSYLPDCVVYTGTHDNDTVKGWFQNASEEDRRYACEYMNCNENDIHWDFIRTAWASVANISIAPMQDLLGIGSEGRMNLPGTTEMNWEWRLPEKIAWEDISEKLLKISTLYGRNL